MRQLGAPGGAVPMIGVFSAEGRAWLAVYFFFAALATVNLVGADALGDADAMQRLEVPAFGALFFAWWMALFGSARKAVLAAVIVFAWWWPVELYVRLHYGSPMSAQFVGMALETEQREASEFVISYWTLLVAGLALVVAISSPALLLCQRHPVRWVHWSRWAVLALLPCMALTMLVLFEALEPDSSWFTPAHDPFKNEQLSFWSDKWRSVYPLTMPLAVWRHHADATRVAELRSQSAGFRFGARSRESPLDAVVLVLGESSRADRWSLNGYARTTNPQLQQRSNLVFFDNVVSTSVSTRLAVPAIVSRRPLVGPTGVARQPEPSLITAFKEAGYRTAWLSNQSMSGIYDTSIALYAREADRVRFLNPTTFSHAGSYDEVLVQPLAEFLRAPGPAMAVVHTMGSHFNYAFRYPPEFDRFKPSSKTEGTVVRGVETNNAYDNSILYTDHVLERLIQTLERDGKRSMLIYISDHGVDVYDPSCPAGGPLRRSKWSYRVPAFVWMSDSLARERQAQLDLIKARARLPWQSTAVFQTVMDLAGIEIPIADASTGASILAPVPSAAPRLVADSIGRLMDFDAAEKRGGCVIGGD